MLTAVLNPLHFSQAQIKQQSDRLLKGHRAGNEIRSQKQKVFLAGILSGKTKHLNFYLGTKETQPFPSTVFCTYFSY